MFWYYGSRDGKTWKAISEEPPCMSYVVGDAVAFFSVSRKNFFVSKAVQRGDEILRKDIDHSDWPAFVAAINKE